MPLHVYMSIQNFHLQKTLIPFVSSGSMLVGLHAFLRVKGSNLTHLLKD